MALPAGTKLGPYEIQSPLGAGGMGEVYRALDMRLERTVAVKILPSHLSKDPEAQQRFEREARVISSLNHPNICTLYDVGQDDTVHYLVMEYLEGETLADRLCRSPLPMAQVLKHGVEICEGLEKAHRCGVVHRDLKPGNVMLTKTGAKLMDFGLAKTAVVRTDSSSSLTVTMSTPMGSHPLTAEGTVVGTFQYMSPEQVEGKEADARSDIFALGALLHEMATGKCAFEGKTAASAMAAVLERDPVSISSVLPIAPAGLDHVVHGCLQKDPGGTLAVCRRCGARVAMDCCRRIGNRRSRDACDGAGQTMALACGLGHSGSGIARATCVVDFTGARTSENDAIVFAAARADEFRFHRRFFRTGGD